ncbi:MAG TPA: hypothetical protein VMM82_08560, partial [Spirochaetia bacterium]|nr:hypothetical protein [Spirochaetia bacterium]
QKMVNKLFGEISDLSRKIEEQKRTPQVVPVMVNPPPPPRYSPPPAQPVVINYPQPQARTEQPSTPSYPPGGSGYSPSSAEAGEGFPRFATGGPEEEPLSEPAPFRKRAPSQRRKHAEDRPLAEAPEPALAEAETQEHEGAFSQPAEKDAILEEVPEDLEMPEPGGDDFPEVSEAQEPGAEPAAPPSVDSENLGATDLEPVSLEELPETVPEAEEAPPAAGIPAEQAPVRTSDDVRNELREYLNGVKEKLDAVPAAPASAAGPPGPADLLDYLEKLSDYLPQHEKQRFLDSDVRLAMESLKSKLVGRKGLRQSIAERFHPAASGRGKPLTRPLVVDTFSYLKDLAAWHPDRAVADAMRERVESLVARMGRAG